MVTGIAKDATPASPMVTCYRPAKTASYYSVLAASAESAAASLVGAASVEAPSPASGVVPAAFSFAASSSACL